MAQLEPMAALVPLWKSNPPDPVGEQERFAAPCDLLPEPRNLVGLQVEGFAALWVLLPPFPQVALQVEGLVARWQVLVKLPQPRNPVGLQVQGLVEPRNPVGLQVWWGLLRTFPVGLSKPEASVPALVLPAGFVLRASPVVCPPQLLQIVSRTLWVSLAGTGRPPHCSCSTCE